MMAGRKQNGPGAGVARRASAAVAKNQSPAAAARPRRSTRNAEGVPDIYGQMLSEAGVRPSRRSAATEVPERPLKRRRAGGAITGMAEHKPEEKPADPSVVDPIKKNQATLQEAEDLRVSRQGDDEDDNLEFEEVSLPIPTMQTLEIGSEDDDEDGEDEDIELEDVYLGQSASAASAAAERSSERRDVLELNLTTQRAALTLRRHIDRRKPLSKAERLQRMEMHKMHLLCLLYNAAQRNHWCNDSKVQETLRALLPRKVITYLNPGSNLSQFGSTESLKKGIQQAAETFQLRFETTERGLHRALWAEKPEHLQSYELPSDIESVLDKGDFRKAAKSLQGSRDVGAQLFCALLRSAGVQTRLVCSLQPLSFVPGAPAMPMRRDSKSPAKNARNAAVQASLARVEAAQQQQQQTAAATSPSTPRRRLGHSYAAGYPVLEIQSPTSSSPARAQPVNEPKKVRGESPFPVFWVEVLDVAHQKWQPVDPLVTRTQWKTRALEPPASDQANCLTYAMAFEADGSVRDVTRRYAKAYNSKTRRMRVDGVDLYDESWAPPSTSTAPQDSRSAEPNRSSVSGDRWLRRALRRFAKPSTSDIDSIEAAELAAAEAHEPMPRNIQDFRNHPIYALERHLRRHEVLVPGAQAAGTVGAGPNSRGSLERVYRRRDVRIARSSDKWFRMGREVRAGEVPAKILPKQQRQRQKGFYSSAEGDEEDEKEEEEDPVLGPSTTGTPLFTREQTELYAAPPVVGGAVPKNKFGNVEVYVPSMIPPGGAHIPDDRAARAAHICGVDYAPALTGFDFTASGGFGGRRRGTAVLRGAVVPAETEKGVRAVIAALDDLDAEAEEERRSRRAVRLWGRFLMALRIRERIWSGVGPEDEDGRGEGRTEARREGYGVNDVDEERKGVMEQEEEEYGAGTGAGGFFNDDDDGDKGKGVAIADEDSMDIEDYDDDEEDDDDGGGGFLME